MMIVSLKEIWLKLKSNQLSKSFGIYVVGRALSVLISILLIPLFTKHLPSEDFGVVALLWLIIPFMVRVITSGTDYTLCLRFFKLDKKEFSNQLYHSVFLATIVTLLLWGAGLLFPYRLHYLFDNQMTPKLFSYLIIALFSLVVVGYAQNLLRYQNRPALNVLFTIGPQAFTVFLTYHLILNVNTQYGSYIMGVMFGNSLFAIIAIIMFAKQYPIKAFHFSAKRLKSLLYTGIPTLPNVMAIIILASGDRYIIKAFYGLEAVAVYAFGYKFAEYILQAINEPFQKAVAPIIYQKASKDYRESNRFTNEIINSMLIFFPLLLALCTIPMKDIMQLFSTQAYDYSFIIYLISVSGVLLFTVQQMTIALLNFKEQTGIVMLISLITAAINVGLNLWLVPLYGIVAAAYTTIASYIIMLLSSIALTNRILIEKLNIFIIFARLLPFVAFIIGVYYIEAMSQWDSLQNYTSKILLFIILIGLTIGMNRKSFRQYAKLLKQLLSMNNTNTQNH